MYPVQIVLDGDEIAARLAEVRGWFERRNLMPGAFNYNMGAEQVRLRIEFDDLRHAAAFAEDFAGSVIGLAAASR